MTRLMGLIIVRVSWGTWHTSRQHADSDGIKSEPNCTALDSIVVADQLCCSFSMAPTNILTKPLRLVSCIWSCTMQPNLAYSMLRRQSLPRHGVLSVGCRQSAFVCQHSSSDKNVNSRRRGSRSFRGSGVLHLNRILFDPSEIDASTPSDGEDDGSNGFMATVTLPKDDYRTIHVAKILGLKNGDTLRAGSVRSPKPEDENELAGLVTDDATITWLPEGKIKKAQPTANGEPPGSLKISIPDRPKTLLWNNRSSNEMTEGDIDLSTTPPVSLLLALPRPLQLGRILPMVSQLGIDHIILTNAKKVPKVGLILFSRFGDIFSFVIYLICIMSIILCYFRCFLVHKDYFGSHLFRKPEVLRGLLVEGLAQSGDVRLPHVTVAKQWKKFMEDDLDDMFPPGDVVRVIAHPERRDVGEEGADKGKGRERRMSDIDFPMDKSGKPRRMLVAVGPEGGWEEPYELDKFIENGFSQITLGTRVLRSDVAVVSLLALAHELCAQDLSDDV